MLRATHGRQVGTGAPLNWEGLLPEAAYGHSHPALAWVPLPATDAAWP